MSRRISFGVSIPSSPRAAAELQARQTLDDGRCPREHPVHARTFESWFISPLQSGLDNAGMKFTDLVSLNSA